MNEEGKAADRMEGASSIAAALALSASGTLDPRAAAFLEKQSRLTDLQIEDIQRENRLRHWQLRFGNVSAVMKAAFEIALAFIFLAIAVGIGAAIWTAAHDDSLVIEAFSVPPDMAARGLTGQAVAAQLEDKLAAMQDATDSARPASSYANNWGDDIKVQIPDTGISIAESYHLLTAWLGHQTRITGEVYRTATGIAIATHVGTDGSASNLGSEKDFDAVVERAAEAIYARTQPYRYAIYEQSHGRFSDTRTILTTLSVNGASPAERGWALIGLGNMDSDLQRDVGDIRRSLAIIPDQAIAWQSLGVDENALGHAEAALAMHRKTAALLEGRHAPVTTRAATITLPAERASTAELLGDFAEAVAENRVAASLPDYSHIADSASANIAFDLAQEHDASGAERVFVQLPHVPPFSENLEAGMAFLRHDWRETLRREATAEAAFRLAVAAGFDPYARVLVNETQKRAMTAAMARAYAGLGDFARARAIVATTPSDCYDCLRMRGEIDAAAKTWNAANFWFVKAVTAAPDIPFAYADWGEMLLDKGDLDGAMAKFSIANEKGPHFADPLEMWGETLMLDNRSDLALAKFEEANKYAPNWGRLHLKWGEALIYAGQKDEAKKQFALAASLDLSAADKAVLTSTSARIN